MGAFDDLLEYENKQKKKKDVSAFDQLEAELPQQNEIYSMVEDVLGETITDAGYQTGEAIGVTAFDAVAGIPAFVEGTGRYAWEMGKKYIGGDETAKPREIDTYIPTGAEIRESMGHVDSKPKTWAGEAGEAAGPVIAAAPFGPAAMTAMAAAPIVSDVVERGADATGSEVVKDLAPVAKTAALGGIAKGASLVGRRARMAAADPHDPPPRVERYHKADAAERVRKQGVPMTAGQLRGKEGVGQAQTRTAQFEAQTKAVSKRIAEEIEAKTLKARHRRARRRELSELYSGKRIAGEDVPVRSAKLNGDVARKMASLEKKITASEKGLPKKEVTKTETRGAGVQTTEAGVPVVGPKQIVSSSTTKKVKGRDPILRDEIDNIYQHLKDGTMDFKAYRNIRERLQKSASDSEIHRDMINFLDDQVMPQTVSRKQALAVHKANRDYMFLKELRKVTKDGKIDIYKFKENIDKRIADDRIGKHVRDPITKLIEDFTRALPPGKRELPPGAAEKFLERLKRFPVIKIGAKVFDTATAKTGEKKVQSVGQTRLGATQAYRLGRNSGIVLSAEEGRQKNKEKRNKKLGEAIDRGLRGITNYHKDYSKYKDK